jgi:hypothetical protein
MDGKPEPLPARVVYKKMGKEFGAEWAILHVEKRLDAHLQLGTLVSPGDAIYAFGVDWNAERRPTTMDRQSGLKFSLLAGRVIARPERIAVAGTSIIETDLPLWKGDSGSAVISKDEKLVGVFVGVDIGWTTLQHSAIACVPDMAEVASIIAKDRQRAKTD